MKTAVVVGVVVSLHVVVATVVLLAPGCRSPKPAEPQRRIAVMPEPIDVKPVAERPAPRPAIQPPVAPPVVATEKPPVSADYKEYVVLPDDVLSRIARRTGVTVSEIVALNRLSDPDRIVVGQTLLLPPHARLDRTDAQAAAPAPVLSAVHPGAVTHEVQPGEVLSAIAQRYGVKIQDITKANNLADPNRIRAGQKLVIPGGRAQPPRRETRPETSAWDAEPWEIPGEITPAPAPQQRTERDDWTTGATAADDAFLDLTRDETIHVVGQGETLESIAAKYGKRADELQRHNNLSSRHVATGQTLKIPGR